VETLNLGVSWIVFVDACERVNKMLIGTR
jgi:hypothetical protein